MNNKCDKYCWISLHLNVVVAEVAFESKLVNRCGVVHSNLFLLCIVSVRRQMAF